jgi:hypothetical protein
MRKKASGKLLIVNFFVAEGAEVADGAEELINSSFANSSASSAPSATSASS